MGCHVVICSRLRSVLSPRRDINDLCGSSLDTAHTTRHHAPPTGPPRTRHRARRPPPGARRSRPVIQPAFGLHLWRAGERSAAEPGAVLQAMQENLIELTADPQGAEAPARVVGVSGARTCRRQRAELEGNIRGLGLARRAASARRLWSRLCCVRDGASDTGVCPRWQPDVRRPRRGPARAGDRWQHRDSSEDPSEDPQTPRVARATPQLTHRTIFYIGMFGGFALATTIAVYKPDTRCVRVVRV
jgi:hypothetical protein